MMITVRCVVTLTLAFVVSLALAAGVAFGIQARLPLMLSDTLPALPTWFIFAVWLLAAGAVFYSRFGARKRAPPQS